jgi:hypothetical protein
VHSGKEQPRQPFVSVPYRGHWFWIEEADLPAKTTLAAVMILFNFLEAGGSKAAPVLTIPPNWRHGYPIAILPAWMQFAGKLLPVSYVFEGLRTIIAGGTVPGTSLLSPRGGARINRTKCPFLVSGIEPVFRFRSAFAQGSAIWRPR